MDKYVRDVMTKDVVIVEPEAKVRAAINIMNSRNIHSVLVSRARGRASYQILTHSDIIELIGEGLNIDTEEVGRNANDVIYTAEPDWLLSKCAEHMKDCGVKHLPVMSPGNNKLEGIISSSDIVRNI